MLVPLILIEHGEFARIRYPGGCGRGMASGGSLRAGVGCGRELVAGGSPTRLKLFKIRWVEKSRDRTFNPTKLIVFKSRWAEKICFSTFSPTRLRFLKARWDEKKLSLMIRPNEKKDFEE